MNGRGNRGGRGGRRGESARNFGIGPCQHCGRSERCERCGFIRDGTTGRSTVAEHAIGYRLAPRYVEGPIDQNEYVLKNVISRKFENGYLFYLIEWENWPHSADFTWEPIQKLYENIEFVIAYEIGLTRSTIITIDALRRAIRRAYDSLHTVMQPTTSRAEAVEVAAAALARLVRLNPLLLGQRRMSDLRLMNVGVTPKITRDVATQTERPQSQSIAIQTETSLIATDETLNQRRENIVEYEVIRNRAAAAAMARISETVPTTSNVNVDVDLDVLNQPEASTSTPPTQTDTRNYACNLCNYKTKTSYNLKRHQKSCMQRNNDDNDFVCPTCGKHFKKESGYLQHIRHVNCEKPRERRAPHGNESPPNPE